ncbi:MAG: cholesterol esterase [Sclerophora amabilis]|nr:MAG: cholesterol esterase [Sclerophora amabilis]
MGPPYPSSEYIAIFASFILIGLESFIRIITLALPQPIIWVFYKGSRSLFNFWSSPQSKKSRTKKKTIVNHIRDASDFVDLCALYGYDAEEHVVQTGDGYLLGLHRLGWKKGEEGIKVNGGENSVKKRVVYLHHGLLMNSEVWVCITDAERCLPFQLVEKGFDVWLGNNRGNKYSKKSVNRSPTSPEFWNFSMDQFAFHDIPDSISYILDATQQSSLSYIGFSQGTAQAFATLSIHPKLNDQVDLFIALAPAMSPPGLSSSVVDALIKASPEVIFLAFGRKSILSSTTMWQTIIYPPIFVRIIDIALLFLFNWTGRNISPHQKLAAYSHLYSYTSTKSVVHWFQIMRNKCFQMYDDEVSAPLSVGSSIKYYKVPKFPTRNIKTPIVLVYGGCDSLVDINVMLKELPKHTIVTEIPHFEHLDFLWGDNVNKLVFPLVYDALDSYAGQENAKEKHSAFNNGRYISASHLPSYSEDERYGMGRSPATSSAGTHTAFDESDSDNLRVASYATTARAVPGSDSAAVKGPLDKSPLSSQFPSAQVPVTPPRTRSQTDEEGPSLIPRYGQSPKRTTSGKRSEPAEKTTTTKPGAQSSTDDRSATSSSKASLSLLQRKRPRGRSNSLTSSKSYESNVVAGGGKPGFIGAEGISLGMGKAVGGVVSRGVEGLSPEKEKTTSTTERKELDGAKKAKGKGKK